MTGGNSSSFMTQLVSKAQAAGNAILLSASLPTNPVSISPYVVSITHFAQPSAGPTSRPSISCKPGFYVTSNNICIQCEAGTMSDTYHDTKCYDCPAGTFATDTSCELCPGYFFSLSKIIIMTIPLLSFHRLL